MNVKRIILSTIKYCVIVFLLTITSSFAIWTAFQIANAQENPWRINNDEGLVINGESESIEDSSIKSFTETAGDFTVTEYGTPGFYEFNDPVLTIKDGANLEIKNTNPNVATDDRIEVNNDSKAEITLAGVNISSDVDDFCAFKIADNNTKDVTITLKDGSTNLLHSGRYAAGLQKNGVFEGIGKLTIKAETGDEKTGSGILQSTCGFYAAGIGGGKDSGSSNITISGGTVSATGGYDGSGIGGGRYSEGSNISITGGTVNATGDSGGAGIGGGYSGAGSNITISGGKVTATCKVQGAGIGGGAYAAGFNIKISNSTVIANGGDTAAGIGGGAYGAGYNITISSGTVTATKGWGGDDIGSGLEAYASDIFISGGSVKASNIGCQPKNVQGGKNVYPVLIKNPYSATVYIEGSTQPYEPCNHIAADPNDTNLYVFYPVTEDYYLDVNLEGQTIIKYKFVGEKWIEMQEDTGDLVINAIDENEIVIGEDYIFNEGIYIILSNKFMSIKNKDISRSTNSSIEISNLTDANIRLDGVNIYSSCAFKIEDNSTKNTIITLKDDTTNVLKSGNECAGIQKNGESENSGNLTIQAEADNGKLGNGVLQATGGYNGAGIGGGNNSVSSNITINGGVVIARSERDGAGIGGGNKGEGSNITITGGTITATSIERSSGIGSGSNGASASDIFISGGSVKASSISCQPKDAPNGYDVYLMIIKNIYSDNVYIGDSTQAYNPCNHSAADPTDRNLYVYHSVTEDYFLNVKVWEITTKYRFVGDRWIEVQEDKGELEINAIGEGNAIIGEDYVYFGGKYTILSSKPMYIKNKYTGQATNNCIEISKMNDANIRLDGINIISDCAFKIADNSTKDVIITLKDDTSNILFSKLEKHAGLQKNGDSNDVGKLTIQGEIALGKLGNGTLYATGGENSAGIGGGDQGAGSNITISGGLVNATSLNNGAAIGGGYRGEGSNIIISGGSVNATSLYHGAGIGGGFEGSGFNITISGGSVNVMSLYNGAGIGGGDQGEGSNITISGGSVNATSLYHGAGIGGGGSGEGSNITISGGTVTTTGGIRSNDIGGGYTRASSNIIINGGSVKASRIGCQPKNALDGDDVYLMTIRNPNSDDVYIGDSSQPYKPCNHKAADPNDTNLYVYYPATEDNYLDVKVGLTISEYMFIGDRWAVVQEDKGELEINAIGEDKIVMGEDYIFSDGAYIILSNTPMSIKNKYPSQVTNNCIEISKWTSADIRLDGVNIKSTCAFKIGNNNSNDVIITLKDGSSNTLVSENEYYAGLQKNGDTDDVGNLTIKAETGIGKFSNGILEATGGLCGAGIGGGFRGWGSNITINGCTVIAKGGEYGAGIGGGFRGWGTNITINGGTVTAMTSDECDGIGSGTQGRNASNIYINGGSVKASSIGCQPQDAPSGNDVYLMTIENPDSADVYIGDSKTSYEPCNHTAADSTDTNLYTYQADTPDHYLKVTVDDDEFLYYFDDDNKKWELFVVTGDLIIDGFQVRQYVDYDYDASIGEYTIKSEKPMTIKNKNGGVPTSDHIVINEGIDANITLAGVNIDVSSIDKACAFKIANNSTGNVTLTLSNGSTNVLKSGNSCAGLQKNGDGKGIGNLTIKSESIEHNEELGILEVIGAAGGAGIGGGNLCVGSNITINGVIATATGGDGGDGIGSGNAGAEASNIFISGGSVKASSIGCQPKDAKGGQEVYLMTIENPNSSDVFIGDSKTAYKPCNHAAAPHEEEPDTNLYTYQADTQDHYLDVRLDDKVILYKLDNDIHKWIVFECDGNLNISGYMVHQDVDFKYENGEYTILSATPMTIKNKIIDESTSDHIVIKEDIDANITLAGVNINSDCAFKIADNSMGKVTITLKDDTLNTLNSSMGAGLQKNGDSDGSLTIQAEIGDEKLSNGILIASGGDSGAGIGGEKGGTGANITISAATITATGNGDADDIGNGLNSTEQSHDIYINGGSVKAHKIGCRPKDATGGRSLYLMTIKNPGSADVYIGDSEQAYEPCNHLAADATDTNLYTYQAVTKDNYQDVRVGDELVLYKFDYSMSEWIVWEPDGDLDISGFNVHPGVDYDYDYDNGLYTIKSNKLMTIKNKNVDVSTSNHILINQDISANITLAGINITSECAFKIADDSRGKVTITLKDDSLNTLNSLDGAGLQKNDVSDGSLTIQAEIGNEKLGNGTLITHGSSSGAGIGGSSGKASSNIIISSGIVNVTGGYYSAGIGGGNSASCSNITISGGTVTAIGGDEGDGIGRGADGEQAHNIFISGGSVKASSIGCTPKDKEDGNDVALLMIPNENYYKIRFDNTDSFYEPCNHAAADPLKPDTKLYTYQPAVENNTLMVGYFDNFDQLLFMQTYKYYNNMFNLVESPQTIQDLRDQIYAATAGSTIQFDVDYISEYVGCVDESIIIDVQNDITLDLCGHSIDIGNNIFHITSDGKLNVIDSTATARTKNGLIFGHKVNEDNNSNENIECSANTAIFYNEGNLNIQDITIGGTNEELSVSQISAIYNNSRAIDSLTIANCNFKFNQSLYDASQSQNEESSLYGGSCLYNEVGQVVISTTSITDCSSPNGYGGAICNLGQMELDYVNIRMCSALYGAGLYNASLGRLVFYNSSIINCTAAAAGGGIYVSSLSEIILDGDTSQINSNTGLDSVKDNIYFERSDKYANSLLKFGEEFGNSGEGAFGIRVSDPIDPMLISETNDKVEQWKSSFVYDSYEYEIETLYNRLILRVDVSKLHNIEKGQSDHVSGFAIKEKEFVGHEVDLPQITIEEGYTFKAWHVTDSTGKTIEVSEKSKGEYYFVMPEFDVTVVAEVNGYKASSITVEGAEVTPPSGVVEAGQNASYEITLDRGISLDGDIVVYNKTKGEVTSIPVVLANNHFYFIMPMFDAEVHFSVKVDFYYIDCYLNYGDPQILYDTQNVTPSSVSVKPTDPSREGYAFGGWYENPECSGEQFTFGTTIDRSYDLYAKWTPYTYTVSFNMQGHDESSQPESQIINYGDFVEEPQNTFAEAGWTFGGWYTDAECKYIYDFSTPVYKSFTLYAKWSPKFYTVNYDTNGGNPWPSKENVKWDDFNLLPPDNVIVKIGYVLEGWYSDAEFDNQVKNSNTYGQIAKDDSLKEITLYAKWHEESNHCVYYDTNGGLPLIDPLENVGWTQTDLLPKVTVTKEGYTFIGWFNGGMPVDNQMAFCDLIHDEHGDATLVAQWSKEDKYYVYYDTDGGSYIEGIYVNYNDAGLIPKEKPKKLGYTFDGWYSDFERTIPVTKTTTYAEIAGSREVKYICIYAKWIENSNYVVNYETYGGTYIPSKENVKWTQANLLPDDDPVKEGYVFQGWYSDEEFLYPVTQLTTYAEIASLLEDPSSITFYAKWGAKTDTYLVIYETDDGTKYPVKSGVEWTDNNLLPSPEPVKEGYTFDGWFDGIEKSSNKVDNNTMYCQLKEAAKEQAYAHIYAHWTENDDYVVKYDCGQYGPKIEPKTNVRWTQYNLCPEKDPELEGYTFAGWFKDTDFINPVEDTTRYKDLAESDLQEFVTIYAKWIINSYTVNFNLNGHGQQIAPQIIQYGSKIIKPADPVEENYTFNGWFKDESCTIAWDFENDTVKADTTLFASWTYNDIPIPVPVPPVPTPGESDIATTGDALSALIGLLIVAALSAGFVLRTTKRKLGV